jgi:hypothetical protein
LNGIQPPFSFGVGVVNDEAKASAAPSGGVLEHLHVSVGVAKSRNRAAADMLVDTDWLARSVVNEVDLGQAREHRLPVV